METKNTIKSYIIIIFMILMIIISIIIGVNIKRNGEETINFCKAHYKNKTFLSTMVDDNPASPIQCGVFIDQKWYGNWGKNIPYQNCLKYNSSDEQIKFRNYCHWMGPDYFILFGTLLFKYIFPITLMGILIAVIFSMNKNDNNKR